MEDSIEYEGDAANYPDPPQWTKEVLTPVDPLAEHKSVDEQLEGIILPSEPTHAPKLMIVPRAVIFYETPEDRKLESRVPLANISDQRLMFRVSCSSPIIDIPVAAGVVDPQEIVFLSCHTARGLPNFFKEEFCGNRFFVQCHPYPKVNSCTKAAVVTYWKRKIGSPLTETHFIDNMRLVCPSKAFPKIQTDLMDLAFNLKDTDDEPELEDVPVNWEHLEYDFRTIGLGLQQYSGILKTACMNVMKKSYTSTEIIRPGVPTPVFATCISIAFVFILTGCGCWISQR